MRTPRRVCHCRVALVLATALVAVAAQMLLGAPVAGARAASVARALSYLRAHQTKAGGFQASLEPPAATTPWCIMAIAAAGQSPAGWHRSGGRTPIQYLQSIDLRAAATADTSQAGNAATFYAKVIIAYDAAHRRDLIKHAGARRINLVQELLAYQSDSGLFSANGAEVNTTSWAIMGLKASGRAASAQAKAVAWLRSHAASNGGFSWNEGGAPDADSTAAAVEALRAGGVKSSSTVVRRALAYLRTQQQDNGGFASDFGSSATAESTAWAIQAIVASGGNPSGSAWKRGSHTPLAFLGRLQAASGAFYHVGHLLSAPLLTTSETVVALERRPYPL